MRLSHSTVVGILDDCAYRVGLKSIVKLPSPTNGRLAVGTAFHAAIEAHEKERMQAYRTQAKEGSVTGLSWLDTVAEAHWALSEQQVDWEKDELTPGEAGAQAVTALKHWWETPIPDGQPGGGGSLRDRVMEWRPMGVEIRWNLWLPPHTSLPVVGFIDGIYLDQEDELVVVDNKTAARLGKWRLDGVGLQDQAATYVLATMRSTDLPGVRAKIPRFEYHVARITPGKNLNFQGSRVIPITVDEVDLAYIEQRVGQAHQQQLDGDWPKNPDSWICDPKWCPFHQDAGGSCNPYGPAEYDIEVYRER